jgi:hypothetical protein
MVSAVRGGMSKARAARTFDVSPTSVGRYVATKPARESLWLRRRAPDPPRSWTREPTSPSKGMLESVPMSPCPYVTLQDLQERHDYTEAAGGIWVGHSTPCRAIARIGPTSKKGGESPPSATSSPRQPVPERGGRARPLGDPPEWRIGTPNLCRLLEDRSVVYGEQGRPKGLSPPFRAAGPRIAPGRALLYGGSAGTGIRSFSFGKHRQLPE